MSSLKNSRMRAMRLGLSLVLLTVFAALMMTADGASAQSGPATVTYDLPAEVPVFETFTFEVNVDSPEPLSFFESIVTYTKRDVLEVVGVRPGAGWEDADWAADGTRADFAIIANRNGSMKMAFRMPEGQSVPAGVSVPMIVTLRVLAFTGSAAGDSKVPFRNSGLRAENDGGTAVPLTAPAPFIFTAKGGQPTPTAGPSPTPDPSRIQGQVSVSTPGGEVEAGDIFTVEIRHETTFSVQAFQTDVTFDQRLARVLNFEVGDAWQGATQIQGVGSGGSTQTVAETIASGNQTGALRNIGLALLTQPLEGGEYTAIKITMQAIAGGELEIGLAGSLLGSPESRRQNNSLEIETEPGTIQINGDPPVTPEPGATEGPTPTALPSRDARIFYDPPTSGIVIDKTSSVSVNTNVTVGVSDVSGEFRFDHSQVNLESVTLGSDWDGASLAIGDNGAELEAAIAAANQSGTLSFSVQSPDSAGASGETELLVLTYRGIARVSGASVLSFASISINDSDGIPIPVTQSQGAIEVFFSDLELTPTSQSQDNSGRQLRDVGDGFPWVAVLGLLFIAGISSVGAVVALKGRGAS